MSDNNKHNDVPCMLAWRGVTHGSAAIVAFAVGGGLAKTATAMSSYNLQAEEIAAAETALEAGRRRNACAHRACSRRGAMLRDGWDKVGGAGTRSGCTAPRLPVLQPCPLTEHPAARPTPNRAAAESRLAPPQFEGEELPTLFKPHTLFVEPGPEVRLPRPWLGGALKAAAWPVASHGVP